MPFGWNNAILNGRFVIARTGGLIDAITAAVAATGSPDTPRRWTVEMLLAIGSRETGYLWQTHWARYGDWAILGDQGHGHGVWQIDDRSHADFTSTDAWKDPRQCAAKAIEVLNATARALTAYVNPIDVATDIFFRLVIAGYNCGPRNACLGWRNHGDPDKFTTQGNYSADVIAEIPVYLALLNPAGEQPIDPPETQQ
jgi:hypothetical protein